MEIFEVGKNKLTAVVMKNFLLKVKPDEVIVVTLENEVYDIETRLERLGSDIFEQQFIDAVNVHEDELITIVCEDAALIFTQFDFNWWAKTEARRSKLFDVPAVAKDKSVVEVQEVPNKRSGRIESSIVASGIQDTTTKAVTDIELCEGTAKEIVAFINGQIRLKTIALYGSKGSSIVFAVFEDEIDDANWFTVDELVAKGIVTL